MRNKLSILLLIGFSFTLSVLANTPGNIIQKETYSFAMRGTDTLYLDRYYAPSLNKVGQKRACLMFAFGGGFYSGQRDAERYIPFFKKMAEYGYDVISYDYRLGLKDLDASKIKAPTDIIPVLKKTINQAVEDTYEATNFVLKNAEKWNIDTKQIIASGSSAGAIAVLQAEYEISNQTPLTKVLPAHFNYGGIISFAGAILSLEGDLKWKNKPCPIQFFHGDADGNVPYNKLEFFTVGFYGSKHIAHQLTKMKSPYYFYDISDHGHEIADSPMQHNLTEMQLFIKKLVIEKQSLIIDYHVEKLDQAPKKKEHTIMDYIINNFGL